MGTRCVPKNSLNIIAKPTALCNNEIPPVCGDVAVSSSFPPLRMGHAKDVNARRTQGAGRGRKGPRSARTRWGETQEPARRAGHRTQERAGRGAEAQGARARKTRWGEPARARRALGAGRGTQDTRGTRRTWARGARSAGRGARGARVCGTLIKRANDRTAYVFSMGSAARARTPHAPWAIIPP